MRKISCPLSNELYMAGVRLALVRLIGRPLSRPGSGEFQCVAVLAQRYTLMGNNTQISARLSGAQ
jgi:hypothetical protein